MNKIPLRRLILTLVAGLGCSNLLLFVAVHTGKCLEAGELHLHPAWRAFVINPDSQGWVWISDNQGFEIGMIIDSEHLF